MGLKIEVLFYIPLGSRFKIKAHPFLLLFILILLVLCFWSVRRCLSPSNTCAIVDPHDCVLQLLFSFTKPRETTRFLTFSFILLPPQHHKNFTSQWPTLLTVVSLRTSSLAICLARPSSRLSLRSSLLLLSASDTFAILS